MACTIQHMPAPVREELLFYVISVDGILPVPVDLISLIIMKSRYYGEVKDHAVLSGARKGCNHVVSVVLHI